jgi:hypothetical protein
MESAPTQAGGQNLQRKRKLFPPPGAAAPVNALISNALSGGIDLAEFSPPIAGGRRMQVNSRSHGASEVQSQRPNPAQLARQKIADDGGESDSPFGKLVSEIAKQGTHKTSESETA